MNNVRILKYVSVLLFLLIVVSGVAQDKHRTYVKLNYTKDNDNNSTLQAEVKTRIEGKFYQIPDAPVNFYLSREDTTLLLGTQTTDADGFAVFNLQDKSMLDSGRVALFLAEFEGSDTLKARETDVEVKDIDLAMSLEVVDSVKTITVSATQMGTEGSEPVSEVEVQFFVQRLYSLLPIGSAELYEGECGIEFPDDLPGDPYGNVEVFAKIIDSDPYGNVTKKQTIDWGVPVTLVTEDFNPFTATPYIVFMIVAILVIGIVAIIISKAIKKPTA